MHLYVDLDFFMKARACSIWEDTLLLFGESDFFAVDSFQHSARNHAKKIEKKGFSSLATVYEQGADYLANNAKEIKRTGEFDSIMEQLSGIENIDPGEALLLAAAMLDDSAYILCTGDKRFIKALEALKAANMPLAQSIKGKILHFEQLLYALMNRLPADEFAKKVTAKCAQDCDNVVKIAFHQGFTREGALAALESYRANFFNEFCIPYEEIDSWR